MLAVAISPTIPDIPLFYTLAAIFGLLIGFLEFSVLAGVIDSGVVTTFVCLAEDPQAIAVTKPALFQELQKSYPQASFCRV
jgi:hypothetical protein